MRDPKIAHLKLQNREVLAARFLIELCAQLLLHERPFLLRAVSRRVEQQLRLVSSMIEDSHFSGLRRRSTPNTAHVDPTSIISLDYACLRTEF